VLARACINQIKNLKPHEASNALWAIAKVGLKEDNIVKDLVRACVDRAEKCSAMNAVHSL